MHNRLQKQDPKFYQHESCGNYHRFGSFNR
jgi:hypothetical protein